MPFGATPVCPWISSQNPTPVTSTVPVRFVKLEDEMVPQLESKAARAAAIAGRLKAEATQWGSGNSTIIVCVLEPGTESTRWMSESSSIVALRTCACTL